MQFENIRRYYETETSRIEQFIVAEVLLLYAFWLNNTCEYYHYNMNIRDKKERKRNRSCNYLCLNLLQEATVLLLYSYSQLLVPLHDWNKSVLGNEW